MKFLDLKIFLPYGMWWKMDLEELSKKQEKPLATWV